jgi:hypothetical protein
MSGILGWLRNAFIGMKVCLEIPSLLLCKDNEFQSSWCHMATEFEIASDMVKPPICFMGPLEFISVPGRTECGCL